MAKEAANKFRVTNTDVDGTVERDRRAVNVNSLHSLRLPIKTNFFRRDEIHLFETHYTNTTAASPSG